MIGVQAKVATKLSAEEIAAIEPIEDRLRVAARALLINNETIEGLIERDDDAQKALFDEFFAHELSLRQRKRIARLISQARFPVRKDFSNYEWSPVSFPAGFDRQDLLDLSFMDRAENVVCMGAVGTGKTHLMIALGELACSRGREVRYYTTSSLVGALLAAKERGTASNLFKTLARQDAILLDEFGYVPVDRDGARMLFQVVSEAYERQSLIITTNLDFSRWATVLADDQMASAVIDRVAHHGHLLVFEGESYRLRHALMRQ